VECPRFYVHRDAAGSVEVGAADGYARATHKPASGQSGRDPGGHRRKHQGANHSGPLDFKGFILGWRTAWLADPEGNIVELSQGFVDQDNPPSLPAG